jgi:hypothetical protein
MRQAQDRSTGHLLEAAVNTHHRWLALLAILLLILLTLLPRPTQAEPPTASTFEQLCERNMRPSIVVRAHRPGYVVHNTVSSRVLNTRGAHNVSGQAMMGLTASSTRAEIFIDGPGLSDSASGRDCIAARIEVDLSYEPLDVYVAREFHPASCSYRAVFEHELQHVAVYAENLPRIEQLVRDELIARYGGRPLYAPRGKALAMLQEQIDTWLRPLIKEELAKVEVQQIALDSADLAYSLSHSCHGELASLMGSSF